MLFASSGVRFTLVFYFHTFILFFSKASIVVLGWIGLSGVREITAFSLDSLSFKKSVDIEAFVPIEFRRKRINVR